MIAKDTLKVDKTSGPDGFNPEFYKAFKFIVVPGLHKVFVSALEGRKVPVSWWETLVVFIPKEGKDLSIPQLYRPILLINADYKILTSILAP